MAKVAEHLLSGWDCRAINSSWPLPWLAEYSMTPVSRLCTFKSRVTKTLVSGRGSHAA